MLAGLCSLGLPAAGLDARMRDFVTKEVAVALA
jgi:hypothetical protein